MSRHAQGEAALGRQCVASKAGKVEIAAGIKRTIEVDAAVVVLARNLQAIHGRVQEGAAQTYSAAAITVTAADQLGRHGGELLLLLLLLRSPAFSGGDGDGIARRPRRSGSGQSGPCRESAILRRLHRIGREEYAGGPRLQSTREHRRRGRRGGRRKAVHDIVKGGHPGQKSRLGDVSARRHVQVRYYLALLLLLLLLLHCLLARTLSQLNTHREK